MKSSFILVLMLFGCVTSFSIDMDSLQRTLMDEDQLNFKLRSMIKLNSAMPSKNERNFTTTFTGGTKRSCNSCNNDTFFPSYACSDGDGIWNGGKNWI